MNTSGLLAIPPSLHRLARARGVQVAFTKDRGERAPADPEAILAALRALGSPVRSPADCEGELATLRRARWGQLLEPVLVAWDGVLQPIELRLPGLATEATVSLQLAFENGERRHLTTDLAALRPHHATVVDGTRYEIKQLVLVEALPPGYHELIIEAPGVTGRAFVISAPSHLSSDVDRREWGAFLPLYAVRTARSWGCGDLTDLGALCRWVQSHGGNLVSTLPLLATFLDEPLFQPSPYVPASRLAWNELFVDLTAEPEWWIDGAQRTVGSAVWAANREQLQRAELQDYRRLAALRRPVLAAMADAAFAGERRGDIERFLEDESTQREYARFRGACTAHAGPWCHWPDGARDGLLSDADVDPAGYRYHAYAQFLAHRQLGQLSADGCGLVLDMPLGVHSDSFDTWKGHTTGLFAPGVSCGAPPDGFFRAGQDWGFPPLHPEAIRRNDYRYVAATLRHHMRYTTHLRIDHVLGLHRLYWVPHGNTPAKGVYVSGHPDEWYAVLCLEASRAGTTLVGEDLGTVARGLRASMARHGLWRTHVLQFSPRSAIPTPSASSLNTHDLPPFAAFQQGHDIDIWSELGLLDPVREQNAREERAALALDLRAWLQVKGLVEAGADRHAVMRGALAHLASSAAPLVMVNLEDLWDEDRPQNVPGTTDDVRPNWRRPARHRLEAFDDVPDVAAALADITRRRLASREARKPQLPAELAERPPVLGGMDADLFASGLHGHVQDVLGSRPALVEGVPGAQFRAWVPGAREVAVVLAAGVRPLRSLDDASGDTGRQGLWEAFVPGAARGSRYRYRITESDGRISEVRDPVGCCEDDEASILWDLDHAWHDHDWRRLRAAPGRPAPVTILARVADDLTWSSTELIASLAGQAASADADHVVLPLAAWRSPGSPFAPAVARGTPQTLMALVDTLHTMGLGVFFEWSPDVLLVEGFDDALWAHPAAAAVRLSAAACWVDTYHADGLRLPAGATEAEWPAGLAERLAAQGRGVVLQTP